MIIDRNKHLHQLGRNQINEKENNLRFIIEALFVLKFLPTGLS